jgi:hypothetical protein
VPILHVQQSSPTRTPKAALAQEGPRVQITIGVAQRIAAQLIQQGLTVPQPVSGVALIDTGAFATCVDEALAQQLHLPVVDVVQIASASHPGNPQNVFPVLIEIAGLPISFNVPRAIGAPLAGLGIQALIGRDVLEQCTLFYNGISGEITLAI